ncbi:MAG: hypothetical protein HDQ95_14015 [Roseburia sp.]|nr:hypothetical protein [Roseburia sp.]
MPSLTAAIDSMQFKDLTHEIKRTLYMSAKDVVRLGYMLNRVKVGRMYADTYDDFDSYLAEELNIDYTMATRFIRINQKYAKSSEGMEIAEQYEGYSRGLLIEMLNMTPEQEAKVTPDMTVKRAREIKKQDRADRQEVAETVEPEEVATSQPVPVDMPLPGQLDLETNFPEYLPEEPEKEEVIDAEFREIDEPVTSKEIATSQPLSVHGLPITEYPPDSLISTEGCGHKYNCFSCSMECSIRQKERYCGEAPLGNPFACDTMNIIANLRSEIGTQCQFVDQDLAYHRSGDDEPSPCCKDCMNPCRYQCKRAAEKREEERTKKTTIPPNENADAQDEKEIPSDIEGVKCILEEQKKLLDDMLLVDKVESLPKAYVFKQKTIVAALAAMICDLEREEETEGYESWLKLPCKCGDTVYVLPTKENGFSDIIEMECQGFSIGVLGNVANLRPKKGQGKELPKMYQPALSDFGKSVFKSEDAAKRLMKEKEEQDA